jgi:hypothetical protein
MLLPSNGNTPWFAAASRLADKGGLADQLTQALEQLGNKVERAGGDSRVKEARVSPRCRGNSKEEIPDLLASMERLETLIHVALEMDHV